MTTGYNAGLDTSDVKISYATESSWATIPAAVFQQLRITAEDFMAEKTRTRPLEINPLGYAQHAITTQESAKGSINFGLSYGTFDDFIAGALNSQWSTPLELQGVAGDITITEGTNVLSSTTTGKFTGVTVGQWIRLAGFTNTINNGVFQVASVTDNDHLVLTGATGAPNFVTETPAAATAGIRGSFIQNSNLVTTFSVEKQLASALFLQYVGCYVSSCQLTMAVGKFVEGVMNFLVQGQQSAVVEAGTAPPTPAPLGRIIDNISGFSAFAVNGAAPLAVLMSVDLTISKQRSASQYGIGSANAVGMRRGTLQVDGKLSLFFKDFTYFNDFVNEPDLSISWQLTDNLGNAYIFTLPCVSIMNPSIVAKGIDQDIVAEFTLEGNPAPATNVDFAGVTIMISRIPAT